MKKFLLFFVSFFMLSLANAGTLSANKAAEFDLNKASPGAMQKHQLGTLVVQHQVRLLKGIYDFAIQGGATGTGNLVGTNGKPVIIPNKAIVIGCIIDVQTPGTTSNAGTLALGTGQAGNDLKVATGAASYTGLVACTPVGSAATSIKMTADRTMTYTIANALTNGKLTVDVQYIMGE